MNCLKNSKQLWVVPLAMLLMMATCILAPRPAAAIFCTYDGYISYFESYIGSPIYFKFRTKPIRKFQHTVYLDTPMDTFTKFQMAEMARSAGQNQTKLRMRVESGLATCPDLDADTGIYTFTSVTWMYTFQE